METLQNFVEYKSYNKYHNTSKENVQFSAFTFCEVKMDTPTVIKRLSIAAGSVLIALGVVGTTQAATVVPNNLETTEGSRNNVFPFNIRGPSRSQRYQQIYSASDFASFSEPELITQILFRPDGPFGRSFASTLPDIQINFSTTTVAVDSLSRNFADNLGSDDTVVFSGPLSLSSANTGPVGGPKDFDIVIDLQTPFLYNPSVGNLLLDVRNFAGGFTTAFDATSIFGDSVSRAFTSISSGNVNSPNAASTDSLGLVTKFVTTPQDVPEPPSQDVPEPASVLGLLTISILGATIRKKAPEK